jgi:hypothetical protein
MILGQSNEGQGLEVAKGGAGGAPSWSQRKRLPLSLRR